MSLNLNCWVSTVAGTILALASGSALLLSGCPRENSNDDTPPPTIRLLVIEDEPLAAAIEREWKASGRNDLSLSVQPASSLAAVKRLDADCIIYPTSMLGELAQRKLIVPLPETTLVGSELNRNDFFPLVRWQETVWGEEVYAVAFGSPQLSLLYRRDVLERLGQRIPATWNEYQELVTAIEQSDDLAGLPNVNSSEWTSACEPMGAGWAGQMLLARAAAYARDPNQVSTLFDLQTMEPRIGDPAFVRALEEIVQANKQHLPAQRANSPQESRRRILEGKCAIAISWPARWPIVDVAEDLIDLPIGCAGLPGSSESYDTKLNRWTSGDSPRQVPLLGVSGCVGSISRSARHTRAAAATLVWLAGSNKGPVIAAASPFGSLCRSSQIQSAHDWVGRQFDADAAHAYAVSLREAKSASLWLTSPRIPGRNAYLAALDTAVQAAVSGEKTPHNALTAAAEQWRKITEELDLKSQQNTYSRSLGLKP